MPLTLEENELLTQVGPGTPGGALLRRYWYPVAVAQELSAEQPTKFVRLLGEDLVLFRDTSGRVGLLADHCAHRGASLCYGRVEERGISCAYHGWLFDTDGNILETPPERNDAIMRHVKQPAYPVQRFIGMYWAYLGPQPAPLIPRYEVWVRAGGRRRIIIWPRLDCNWLQVMENSVDPAHAQILHQEHIGRGRKPVNTTRGFTDDVKGFEFYVNAFGIVKRRTYVNGQVDEHPLIFPNILRAGPRTEIRVPMDDTHTWHLTVAFEPIADELGGEEAEPLVQYIPPFKEPANDLPPRAQFLPAADIARHHPAATAQQAELREVLRLTQVMAQDYTMWETQGAIADRTTEHLSYSDTGVALLRRVLRDNIARVQQGLDPLGVIRDPEHRMIDTNMLDEGQGVRSTPPSGIRTATVPA